MSVRATILKRLAESRNTAVERAVETALLEASPAEQKELAEVLLERNKRSGWSTLIRVFHRLEEPLREKVLMRPRDLFGPLAETMRDSEGPARENVIAIVQRCSDVRLVYLLAEALIDARTEVRTLAGNSLLEAVRLHWRKRHAAESETLETPAPPPAADGKETDEGAQLRAAIGVALQHFKTHRQTTAILAALIHERQQTSELWAMFQDPYDDRTRAATIILRAPSEAALATTLFIALGTSLKPAAIAGISAMEDPAMGEALARESYRLLDPVLREAAHGIAHLKLLPALRKAPPWTIDNWLSWLRMIEEMGLQAAERLAWLARLLEGAPAKPEAVGWKMCVSRAIAETGLSDAAPPLMGLLRDRDERVARYAARLLLAAGGARKADWRERAMVAIPTSPHESVRRMATMTHGSREPERAVAAAPAPPGARGFQKAWSDFQRMPPAMRNAAARSAAADPEFAGQLCEKLQGEPQDIALALRMIAAQPRIVPYRSQIIGLCGHPDPRIAAMAVHLVGRLEDPRLTELLEAAAQHSDPRVRANAIESMETLNVVSRSQQVLAMLNSRHNRERANAIKAIGQFNFGTARECLGRMLSDANPLHRMSALWVVSQLNLLDILRQVSNIARRDPNIRVRKRAAEMLETLSGNFAGHP
jgi:HEAT repeat protein